MTNFEHKVGDVISYGKYGHLKVGTIDQIVKTTRIRANNHETTEIEYYVLVNPQFQNHNGERDIVNAENMKQSRNLSVSQIEVINKANKISKHYRTIATMIQDECDSVLKYSNEFTANDRIKGLNNTIKKYGVALKNE